MRFARASPDQFLDRALSQGHTRWFMEHPYPLEQQLLDATAFSELRWMTKLLDRGVSTEVRDEDNRTPLHLAVDAADRDALAVLLDAGADVNARDHFGYTPLHYATWRRDLAMSHLLLSHGADVNAKDSLGRSIPLWPALAASLPSRTPN